MSANSDNNYVKIIDYDGKNKTDAFLHLAARIDDDTRQVQQEVNNTSRAVMDAMNTDSTQLMQSICDSSQKELKEIADGTRWVGERVCDSESALAQQLCVAARDIVSDTHKDGEFTRSNADRGFAEARGLVSGEGREIRGLVNGEHRETRGLVKGEHRETRDLIRDDFRDLRDGQYKEHFETRTDVKRYGDRLVADVCDLAKQEAEHAKDMEILILKSKSDLERLVDHNGHVLERQAADYNSCQKLQASENTCRLEKDIELSKHEIKLQAAENYARSEIREVKLNAELQKQISDCCCEMKELVREKADETQSLVRQLDNEETKEKLRHVEQELLFARLRPGVPLPV